MFTLPKKFLASILASLYLLIATFGFFPAITYAQTPAPNLNVPSLGQTSTWYNPGLPEFIVKVFGDNSSEIFGERYTFAQVKWIINSLAIIFMPEPVSRCMATLSGNLTLENVSGCLSGGQAFNTQDMGPILGMAAISDSILTTRPASGIEYLANAIKNFHIVPEAYAQGFGYRTLQPVQVLWSATRNMSYFLLIIAFIAMAFMIMFRVRLNPQTVITIQSALPKLALILILITFSYAIAGLLIDISYVSVGLLAAMIKSVNPANAISGYNILDLYNALSGTRDPIVSIFFGLIFAGLILFLVGAAIGFAIGSAAFGLGGTGALVLGGSLFLIFLVFAIIFVFRILWLLLRTLANILLLIIGAPFLILIGIFPNAPGIGSWLRNLIANIAVYPFTIVMLFLAHFFFFKFFANTFVLPAAIPVSLGAAFEILDPYDLNSSQIPTGTIELPGFGGNTGLIGFFLSFALLGLVPQSANIVRSLIQGKPFDYGAALGAYFGTGLGVGTYPLRTTYGTYSEAIRKATIEAINLEAGRIGTLMKKLRGG